MTHPVHHDGHHTADQPATATEDVTAARSADDPLLCPGEVSAMLSGIPQATLTRWGSERTAQARSESLGDGVSVAKSGQGAPNQVCTV